MLQAPVQRELMRLGHSRIVPANTTLGRQGEPTSIVSLLLEGRVTRTRVEPNGVPVMLPLRYPGDLVGELSWLDHGTHSATIVARDRSTLLVFPHRDLEMFMQQRPSVLLTYTRMIADSLHEAEAHHSDAGAYDVERRLGRVLLRQVERYPRKLDEHYVVELRQKELAMLIGARETTVQKALRCPPLRELVRPSRGRILLCDVRRLSAFAELNDADGRFSLRDL
ncbi:Crp/Fnr family transcriptional regulator [Actinomadura bangladeshensis]|uniref:Crp/Fnr family transcriptional regulator n=1 Tax=Actinomadura bangladeshensis TaxID=453573 RepID=A0A6L9QFW1_9ACTN|nr:Crp/Fnr family transcriptional regulator [Actinomadura bangladeshensis]NEA23896.1 Crp/Fnr family transcriptional regulator [Actinomadura bangladeshensis]